MMFKYSARVLTLIVVFACLATASVFATWRYAANQADSVEADTGVGIVEFHYKPEDILPGDQESTQLHENHFNLVSNIVNHIDYGLNATKKPLIRELLEDGAGVVYSNQSVSGGNLKHMLLGSSDVERLMFAVAYITDTEYEAYTFSGLRVNGENAGNYIPVYKTIMQKTGSRWEAVYSHEGQAKVSAPGFGGYSIDVVTWEHV